MLVRTFATAADEAWLGAPAVADLDGDGTNEIIVPRHSRLVVWRPDGTVKWQVTPNGSRIWAPPVVGDFIGDAKLEVAVAAGDSVYLYDAAGALAPHFPAVWRYELRALAAGDLDHDGRPELVTVTTRDLVANGQVDILMAFRGDGSVQPGFPPNTTGVSGCDDHCYVYGGYDEGLAVGRIDDDEHADVFATQDDGYMSWHHGDGVAFDAASIFADRKKVLGIRFLLDYEDAQRGYALDEATALQGTFTNSPPAIVDLDGDGHAELVVVGSVQNAAQTDFEKGVALFVIRPDGTRPTGWVRPFHVPEYLDGRWDLGANIVAATLEVAVARLDGAVAQPDLVFAGYDGQIHAVRADGTPRWTYRFTSQEGVLTSGVVIADLTRDGTPEIVFATYATAAGLSALYILDAGGHLQQRLALPGRGAMPVPTIADVDGDGTLEILVSLKDAVAGSVLEYNVPGSGTRCLPWPMARHDLLRSGSLR